MEEQGKIVIERGNEYYSLHNNIGLEYWMAYNELIDNSIDNNATEIRFEADENSVTIIDNGDGIKDTIEDMRRVLRMYRSSNNGTNNKIGQYGLGLKEATMRLGKGIIIRSRAKDCRPIQIDVPWSTINYDDGATFTILDEDIPVGTSITIFFCETERQPYLPNKYSFKYYDKMILAGKLNIIDAAGEKWIPSIQPEFEGEILQKNNITIQGKQFDLTIGIIKHELIRKVRSGFYVYSNETLRYFNFGQTNLSEGVEARDGLYVGIGLHKTKTDWPVDKNKRGIMNIHEIATYLDMSNIISKWQQKIYNTVANDILEKLSREMAPVFGLNAKAIGEEKRPNKGENEGTVDPVGSGRKRREAEEVLSHDAKIVQRRSGGKLRCFEIREGRFIDTNKYLSINIESVNLVVIVNKNNRLIRQLLCKPDALKSEFLTHLVIIAIKANNIPSNQLRYDNIVDDLFYQHEWIQNRYGNLPST